LSYTTLTIESC
jgi:hypothetical protein